MAVLSSKDVLGNLKKKGFFEVAGDHRYLVLRHLGREVLHTKISHGGKHDLHDFLIKQMSVQCKLDKKHSSLTWPSVR